MRHFGLTLATGLLMMMQTACTEQETGLPGTRPAQQVVQDGTSLFLPDRLHLRLSDELLSELERAGDTSEAREAALQRLASSLGVASLERIFPEAGAFEAKHRAAGLHKWYRALCDTSLAVTKAIAGLENRPGVEKVQRVPRKVSMGTTYFNDPRLPLQWHYYNDGTRPTTGLPYGIFVSGMDINVLPVWQHFTAGSPEVVVAVLDEGIDPMHEDLAPVLLTDRSFNFVPDFYGPQVIGGDHGSHTGGIIGAVSNNGKGIAGIAGGSDGTGGVRLISCQIFQDTLDTRTGKTVRVEGDAAEALVWAADHGAVIANNSWGYEMVSDEQAAHYAERFINGDFAADFKDAVDYFTAHAGTDANGVQTGPMKGGLVFFAAGNTAISHNVIAQYEPIVAVASFGPGGNRAGYSNYGDWVDLAAPGGANSINQEQMILSCITGNDYGWQNGTSMACPHASGVAALILSYFGGPGYTPANLRARLLGGADPMALPASGDKPIGPKLDAFGSFVMGDLPQITLHHTDDIVLQSHESRAYVLHVSDPRPEPLHVTLSHGSAADSLVVMTNGVFQLSIAALKAPPGTYTATVRAFYDEVYVSTLDIVYSILENHGPQQDRYFESPVILHVGEPVQWDLTRFFSDADGEVLTGSAVSSDTAVVRASVSDMQLTLDPCGYGPAEVVVTATDARGESVEGRMSLLARDTDRPVEVYPNPTDRFIYVRTSRKVQCDIDLYNVMGARILSLPGRTVSPFEPLEIDLSGVCDPGRYKVIIRYGSTSHEQQIVKL
ncbi:MAG: S8 family serine peptidase [Bacteroidales bacterium]|nr:S8 family serine peptidase [Bacteroidales bacterium]